MRLDKFLSGENLGSRKDVGLMIRKGRILVNAMPVRKPDFQIEPECDTVLLDGRPVDYARHTYIMMNKPAGVLSATTDKKAKTVLDLIPEELWRRGLFPAGRLDKDTTGLLIITNDGELAHRMLAPQSHVYKLYEAELDGDICEEDIAAFAGGIVVGEQEFLPARLWCEDPACPRVARVLIREGKFHQVKRMFLARGKEVQKLRRLQIGALSLDPDLGEGACRALRKCELEQIFLPGETS